MFDSPAVRLWATQLARGEESSTASKGKGQSKGFYGKGKVFCGEDKSLFGEGAIREIWASKLGGETDATHTDRRVV